MNRRMKKNGAALFAAAFFVFNEQANTQGVANA